MQYIIDVIIYSFFFFFYSTGKDTLNVRPLGLGYSGNIYTDRV